MKPLRVGLSLGNIGRFDDGLGEVARSIGSGLAARAKGLRDRHGIQFAFHLLPHLVGCFGPEVEYLPLTRSEEWWHRRVPRFDVWHTLHQLNRYAPPAGTGLRIATVHDLNYLYVKNAFSRWRDERRLSRLLARHNRITAISDFTRRDIIERTGHGRSIDVIANGVRDLSSDPAEAVAGLEPGSYLFHLSRMARSKNVESLLAMAAVWPDMSFVLAGPDANRNAELRSQADAMGVGRVRILTGISDAQKVWLYANCAGFLFPSLAEGFGLPPLEAMQFGKPVFVSDRTSLPEVCADAAFYFREFDPHSMRKIVEAGLRVHAKTSRADAVRKHAASYSWDRAIDRYLALYCNQGGGNLAEFELRGG